MTRPAAAEAMEASTGSAAAASKKALVSVGNYRMVDLLGKGNFAKVVQAVHTVLKSKVAVKIIDTNKILQKYVLKNLYREAKLLSKLNHPNIIRLYETIQCGAVYYLVTELATGGDLGSHVRSQPGGRLDEVSARCYARQLADGLQHMHSKNIVHRDLKMENIMLKDKKTRWIKIIDFGLSNTYDEENLLKTLCGSPEYAAPELFVKGRRYGPEVDLWSLGVILYVMGTGRLPFTSPRDESSSADERRRRLMVQINRGMSAPQERLIVTLSDHYKNLLRLALMPVAHKRIRLGELRRHPWMSDASANFTTDNFQLSPDECRVIVKEISVLVGTDCLEVKMDIINRRFENIGGMYNIMTHELQLQKLRRSRIKVDLVDTFQNLNNYESASDKSSNNVQINGTFSNAKHDCRSNFPIKDKTQVSFVKNKIFDSRRAVANSKCDVDETKKKSGKSIMLPCLKKISYSVLKQAESNKVHTTKEHFLQKQRKAQQDTVKLVKFCHPVTNRKTDNNIDIKQRNDCFVEKYSTLRNIERHHSSQRSGRCWYLVIGVTLLRGPNFFDIIRYLYIKCEINNYRFKYISCGIKPTLYRVALASLTATYTDSEGEDGADDNFQDNSNSPTEATARSDRSASSSPSDSSNHSSKNNNLPNVPTLVTDVTSKVQRLVSYFDDTVVSDDEGTAVAISEHVFSINGRQHSDVREKQSPDRPLISDNEADEYGVIIPPEPPSACPSDLQEKISKLYVKMEDGRLDMNKVIQNRKDFRNPSIYEKLIQFCNINELGTNYPPDRFDPFKWSKDSYYEELAKAQKVEMEKLEKARKEKTKIEIVSGTAKRPNPTPAVTEEDIKKRKSKWDQVATNPLTGTAVKPAVVTQPALTTLTSSVTGTKTTVISAFGSVPKKRL